jgi:hypothetical protein
MYGPRRGNQVSGAVFLIGLGLLFLTNFWWPGILFVLGAAAIAQGLSEGRGWYALQGGVWLIGIGLVFSIGFSLPLLLILLGLSMLCGTVFRPRTLLGRDMQFEEAPIREKRKNEARATAFDEHGDDEDEDEGRYVLGDDGEMVKVKNDQKRFNR